MIHLLITMLTAVPLFGTASCTTQENEEALIEQETPVAPDNTPDGTGEQNGAPVYAPVPDEYRTTCAETGTIETLTYTTSEQNKTALVYLPYGYDGQQQYDILYLMHGGGGNQTTLLGGTSRPTTLKHVFDHLIADQRIRPMIIVTPTFYTSGTSVGNYPAQRENSSTKAFQQELRNDLILAVEGRYSTFATSVTPEGLKASRQHRAFSGFSMGGTTTWYALMNNLDYFSLFIPVSGDYWELGSWGGRDYPEQTAEAVAEAVRSQGYAATDYYVFAVTGTRDMAYEPLSNQLEAMRHLTDDFTYGYNQMTSNLYLMLAEGGQHDYNWVTDYLYVILPHLFPPIDETSGISNNTLATGKHVARVDYYDMQGVKVQSPQHGTPVIRRTSYTDGTERSEKTVCY